MAKFILTAEIQLRSPRNVTRVVNQIKSQLQGITAQVNIVVPKQQLNQLKQTVKDMHKVSKVTDEASNSMEDFGKKSALAFKRFAAFSLATGGIVGLVQAFKNGLKDAIHFEREMNKIAQATGESISNMKGLASEITRLSTTFGVSSKKLAEVSLTLAQAGLSAKNTKVALEALAKTELAPTFEDIADTAEGAIAIFQQFGKSAKDLESILGSINVVAAKFAVESSDIITAVRRTGGAFEASGGKLEELMALFTSVRATTRESAESIATGFRTIFTRLQRIRTQDFLKRLGVDLRDAEGLFVGPYEAIRKLSTALKNLPGTDPRFAQIIEELGGFRQVSKVIPLIKQFDVAQRALNVAQKGGKSLTEDAAKAQESLAVKLAKVREEFQSLVRSITQNSAFKSLTDVALQMAKAFIQIGKAIEPILPVLAYLGVAKLAGGLKSFASGFTGFKPSKYATGGLVPGRGNRDTVPAQLTPGEFVLRKDAVKSIGVGNLHRMNKFSTGGKAQNSKAIIASLLRAYGAETWYNMRENEIPDRDLIKVLSLIPKGSTRLGHGLEAFAVKTPKNTAARVADLSTRNLTGARPSLPFLLQPLKSIKVGSLLYEELPLADKLNDRLDKSKERKQASYMKKKGLTKNSYGHVPIDAEIAGRRRKTELAEKVSKIIEGQIYDAGVQNLVDKDEATYPPNVGIVGGKIKVIDPGFIGYDEEAILKDYPPKVRVQRFAKGGKSKPDAGGAMGFNEFIGAQTAKTLADKGIDGLTLAGKYTDKSEEERLDKIVDELVNAPGGKRLERHQALKHARRIIGAPRNVDQRLARANEKKKLEGFDEEIGKRVGVVSLFPRGFKARRIQSVPINGQQEKVEIIRKGLPKGIGAALDEKIRQNITDSALQSANEIASLAGITELKTNNLRGTLEKAGFYNAVGTVFEAALAIAGAPYDDKERPGAPIDFPRGIGPKLGNLFGIDPNIPTDATRNSASKKGRFNEAIGAFFSSGVKKYAKGGGVSDTVPAMLTPGEYVFNKESAQRIGYSNLEKMNKIKGYKTGGIVGNAISKYGPGNIAFGLSAATSFLGQLGEGSDELSYLADKASKLAITFTVLEGTLNNTISAATSNFAGGKIPSSFSLIRGLSSPFAGVAENKLFRQERTRELKAQGLSGAALQQQRNKDLSRFRKGRNISKGIFYGSSALGSIGVLGGDFLKERGFKNIQEGRAGRGDVGLGGAISAAGVGASVGAVFGPLGIAVGGVAGAIYGYTSSIKQADEAIQKVKVDKVLERYSSQLAAIASGKVNPREAAFRVRGLVNETQNALLTSTGDNLENVRAGLKNSAIELSQFIDGIRDTSKNFEDFRNVIGENVLRHFARIQEIPVEDIIRQYKEQFQEIQKAIKAQSETNKIVEEYGSQVRALVGIQRTFEQLSIKMRGLDSAVSTLVDTINGNAITSIIDYSDAIGIAAGASDNAALASVLRRDIIPLLNSPNFGGGTVGENLSRDLIEISEAIRILPTVLMSVRGGSDISEADSIIERVVNQFSGFQGEFVKNAIAAQIDQILGAEGKPENFIEKLNSDFFGTIEELTKAFDPLIKTTQEVSKKITEHNNQYAQLIAQRDKLEVQALENLDSNIELEKDRVRLRASLNGRNPDFNRLRRLEDSRQFSFLSNTRQINNPAQIAKDIIDTDREVAKQRQAINNIEGTSATIAAENIQRLSTQADKLRIALKLVSDIAKNKLAITMEQLDSVRGGRQNKRDFAESIIGAESFEDFKNLGGIAMGSMILARTNNIEQVPKEFREETLNFLKGLGNNSPFAGLGGRTGNDIVAETTVQGIQSFFARMGEPVSREKAIEVSGAFASKEEQFLTNLADNLLKTQQTANDGLSMIMFNGASELNFIIAAQNYQFLNNLSNLFKEQQIQDVDQKLIGIENQGASIREANQYRNNSQQMLTALGINVSPEVISKNIDKIKEGFEAASKLTVLEYAKQRTSGTRLSGGVGSLEFAQAEITRRIDEFKSKLSGLDEESKNNLVNKFTLELRKSLEGAQLASGKIDITTFAKNLNKNREDFFNAEILNSSNLKEEFSSLLDNIGISAGQAGLLVRHYNVINKELSKIPDNLTELNKQYDGLVRQAQQLNAYRAQLTNPERKASGGLIGGKGRGDKISALLEPGEYVLNRKTVENVGLNNIMRMQSGGDVRRANRDKFIASQKKRAEDKRKQKELESSPEYAANIAAAKAFSFDAPPAPTPTPVSALEKSLMASMSRTTGLASGQDIASRAKNVDLIGNLRNQIRQSEETTFYTQKEGERLAQETAAVRQRELSVRDSFFTDEAKKQQAATRDKIEAEKIAQQDAQTRELLARHARENAQRAREPSSADKALTATGELASVAGKVITTSLSLPGRGVDYITGGTFSKFGSFVAQAPGIKQGLHGLSKLSDRAKEGRDIIEQTQGGKGRLATGVYDLSLGMLEALLPTGGKTKFGNVPSLKPSKIPLPNPKINRFSKNVQDEILEGASKSNRDLGTGRFRTPYTNNKVNRFTRRQQDQILKSTSKVNRDVATGRYRTVGKGKVKPPVQPKPKPLPPPKPKPLPTQPKPNPTDKLKNIVDSTKEVAKIEELLAVKDFPLKNRDLLDFGIDNFNNLLEELGFKYRVDKKSVSLHKELKSGEHKVAGMYISKTNDAQIGMGQDLSVLYHELGHSIDFLSGNKLAKNLGKTIPPDAHAPFSINTLIEKGLAELEEKVPHIKKHLNHPVYNKPYARPIETFAKVFESLTYAGKDDLLEVKKFLKETAKLTGFKSGGLIGGTGSGDRVPALLEPGEFVMNRNAVSAIGPQNLHRANKTHARFQTGGQVQPKQNVSINMESVEKLNQTINTFNARTENLVTAMNNFPREIELNARHTVEVVINGAQVMTNIMPEIGKLIESQTKTQINNMLKSKFPDVGTM